MSEAEASPRITVVFIDEAVAFGGSVVVLARLLQAIDRRRFLPKLVTGLDRDSVDQLFDPEDVVGWYRVPLGYVARERWMSVCPVRVRFVRSLWAGLFTVVATLANLPASLRLLLKVAAAKPDLLHANNGRGALFVSRFLRVPVVYHLHGTLNQSDRYVRRLRARTERLISISKFVSSTAMEHGVPPAEIEEIPNPAPTFVPGEVNREQYLARFGVLGPVFALAHVGRCVPWKGQLEFLKAFIEIAPAHPAAVALLAGADLEGFKTPYLQTLQRLADNAGLSDRVFFVGHVTDTLSLMSSVDVVVHSSIEPEPFGLVITEAMAVGTAVIAARSGAPMEIVEHGVNGLLVDPKNTKEFADALALLIEDAPRRRAMAEAGRETVYERYSPSDFARRIEAVYDDILGRC